MPHVINCHSSKNVHKSNDYNRFLIEIIQIKDYFFHCMKKIEKIYHNSKYILNLAANFANFT